MKTAQKYRLGNQPEEYELITKYLGWLPEGVKEWQDLLFPFGVSDIKGKELVIVDPNDNNEKIVLVMHQPIVKDAFHFHFWGEERSKKWNDFCIVSLKDNLLEKFIIPLH